MKLLGLALTLLLIGCASHSYDNSTFHYNVPEKYQPNCVVGAFCMYSYEALHVKTSPQYWQTNEFTKFNEIGVDLKKIQPGWNRIFTNAPLKIIYNSDNILDYSNTVFIYNTPYIWIGKFQGGLHACIIYFNTNSITYKHFIYNPWTGTNYMVTTNYMEFFNDTRRIYDTIEQLQKIDSKFKCRPVL